MTDARTIGRFPPPVCHRGAWWPDKAGQNGFPAAKAALAEGWSIEVDVRTCAGTLVLAHDPPDPAGAYLEFGACCDLVARSDGPELFVDVKEPRTVPGIIRALRAHGLLGRAWLFDFELCGADPEAALREDPAARCLVRVSDRGEGTGGAAPSWARGVWIDQWDGEWCDETVIADWHRAGMRVFVVSPELQGRAFDLGQAARCAGADGWCTDHPALLDGLRAGRPELVPSNPWWQP